MSEQVRLRPVVEEDLDHLDSMFDDPDAMGEFLWVGWNNPRKWRRLWQETGLRGGDKYVLMVDAGKERVGFVSWHSVEPGSANCWDIGITLWPKARGQGYGTEAQRQLVRYLFAHTMANRIQATTDSMNLAEQRALEKAGFHREGVLRGYRFRAGAHHDEVLYGIVRSDVTLP